MAGETVLVIDDSPTILKVVQLVLTKAGFSVYTAPDGEEGIARARAERPDLILLDFVMPKMNGYQVCRALAESPELKSIPVVLMSAKGDQVGERFVKVMGIVDYITKPFSP
ncbi:MAG TPA: response regulator, partial [Polyangia bacterium]|nr:response regulator [Polyangia bacterium]